MTLRVAKSAVAKRAALSADVRTSVATIWMVVALNELNMVGLILIKVLFLLLAGGGGLWGLSRLQDDR